MRRYLPLLTISITILLAVFSSANYLAGNAGTPKSEFLKTINVYTTLPNEQIGLLANEFEKDTNIGVNVFSLSEQELELRIKNATLTDADVILAEKTTLIKAKSKSLLKPYASVQLDIIPDRFKDAEGYWTGVWYDPIVFTINRDYLKNNRFAPNKWSNISEASKLRIGITDFLAANAFSNLFFTLVNNNGETQTLAYLKKIHPQISQYSKYLVTPVRMCSLGEVDFAIVVNSEAMRYVYDEFPIKIIYPEDGTAFLLTGIGLVKSSPSEQEAKQFINWLIQDTGQQVLFKNKLYYIPTNPDTKAYKSYNVQNIKLFDSPPEFTPEEQHRMLDSWIQTVRLDSK